jgi:hypothetical protein
MTIRFLVAHRRRLNFFQTNHTRVRKTAQALGFGRAGGFSADEYGASGIARITFLTEKHTFGCCDSRPLAVAYLKTMIASARAPDTDKR